MTDLPNDSRRGVLYNYTEHMYIKTSFQQNNKQPQTLAAGVYTAMVGGNKHDSKQKMILVVNEILAWMLLYTKKSSFSPTDFI